LYDVFSSTAIAIRVPETASSQQLEIMYVNESSHPAAKKNRIRLIHLPYPDGYKVSGLQNIVNRHGLAAGGTSVTTAPPC
jgi:hypothetical protein